MARPAVVEVAKLGVLTRAKARSLLDKAFRGFENPLPGLEVRGWHRAGKMARTLGIAQTKPSLLPGVPFVPTGTLLGTDV